MAERDAVLRIAGAIMREVEREFPHARLTLDFDHTRRDDEDAYLWVTTDTTDEDEVTDLWGYVIQHVQEAYENDDIHIVARLQGRDVMIREKRYDTE